MQGSKYDTNGDGTCSASACKNVLLIADVRQVDTKMVPVIQQSAAKIGITFTVRVGRGRLPGDPDAVAQHPDRRAAGLGQGLRRPVHVLQPALRRPHDPGRTATRTTRSSGSRPRPRRRSARRATSPNVPNVDADLDRCAALAGNERTQCYGDLDKKLMTDVVPWVPYLWSFATHITGPDGEAVGLRPVHGHDRLRARRGGVRPLGGRFPDARRTARTGPYLS